MLLFDSRNFGEIDYLHFSDDFKIEINNKIKFIFAPNGTCKTSIYKNLSERFGEFKFIDYDEIEKSFINNKDLIIVGASIKEIENKNSEKNDIIESSQILDNIKSFDLNAATRAKKISENFNNLRENLENAILFFSNHNLDCIYNISSEQKEFFNLHGKSLIEAAEITTTIEEIKNSYKMHALLSIDRFLDEDTLECPVCGSLKNTPIKEIIQEKIQELNEINDFLVYEYSNMFSSKNSSEVLNDITNLKQIIIDNDFSIRDLENYYFSGGSNDGALKIISAQERINDINNIIRDLEIQRDTFYDNLKGRFSEICEFFVNTFDVNENDISFVDEEKHIKIKLPRQIKKYSTGQINAMTFIICLLEFISSNKDTLIVDDPLSSYDIINQYKIIYEISRLNNQHKNVLVFTHNINALNISSSQFPRIFDYDVIDNVSGILYINNITNQGHPNIINSSDIIANVSDNYPYVNYVKLLIEKDEWESDDDKHKIFHFDESYSIEIDGNNYSNVELLNLIDDFGVDTFCNKNFYENSVDKMLYLAAIRVWIEKQLYDNIPQGHILEGLLAQKISYVFDNNLWLGSENVTKEFLMSRKVLLNQHLHSKSQIMPFYYSLNLNLDDISKEIIDLKSHF